MVQVIIVSALLMAGVGIQSGFANTLDNSGLSTVFHVYSEGEYVGAISDEAKLEQLKEEELEQAASEFKHLPLTVGANLSVIPEIVFKAETEDEPVLEKIHQMLSVEAEAVGISVDGELAVYVSDQTAYDEVIRQLTLQSVTEKELNEFEALASSSEPIPPLKTGETRITDILFSSEIEAEEGKIAPRRNKNGGRSHRSVK